MKNWREIVVDASQTLLETMRVIDEASLQFAVVVDRDNHLLGTVTDGDIRRGILRGEGLEVSITSVMNVKPTTAKYGATLAKYKQLMKSKKLKQLPIVTEQNQVVDVLFLDELQLSQNKNQVVLMLGGLGTRLRPLTNDIPKPMLKVGNKPIVETIVEGFKQYGYTNFIFSVNYKKEVIQNYFQTGEAFGVQIDYVEEEKRMGTAGALSLIENRPTDPFFGPDHQASLNPDQLKELVKQIRLMESLCGVTAKEPTKTELTNRIAARKSIVAKCAIKKGECLTVDNMTIKRPGNGIAPSEWWRLLGTQAVADFKEDTLIYE